MVKVLKMDVYDKVETFFIAEYLWYLYSISEIVLKVLTNFRRNEFDVKIVWLSNIAILNIPDEGYFRNVSCAH
jgi:hypothetical protein